VGAAEHFLDLARLDGGLELVEATDEVGLHVLALTGPFEEHAEVVGAAFQRLTGGLVLFDPAPALQDLLRLGLIFPEIGVGDPLLDVGDLLR
jgi:hypothetical protein